MCRVPYISLGLCWSKSALFFLIFFFFYFLRVRLTDVFFLLDPCTHACNSHAWVRPQLGTWNSIQVFALCGSDPDT